MVVDLGTAITFNAIPRRNAEYLGGVIAAGIGISIRRPGAHALPACRRVDFREPNQLIGTNTARQHPVRPLLRLRSGMIGSIIERLLEKLGPETNVIGTGGQARLISNDSRYLKTIDENLDARRRGADLGAQFPALDRIH